MSIAASFFSSSTAAVLLNTSGNNNGQITLPRTLSTLGRVITFKDIGGNSHNSTITIICSAGDRFEGGSSNYSLQQSYGQVTFLAGADQKWYQLGGTFQVESQVSSLYTSSIVGDGSLLSNVITPTRLASTITGLATAGYVSTSQLFSTTGSLIAQYGQVDAAALASTVTGLGNIYTSTPQFVSTVGSLYATISSYVTETQLTSSVAGLGTANYASTPNLTFNLTSTVASLGLIPYVSTLGNIVGSTLTVAQTASFSSLQTNYMSAPTVTTSSLTTKQFVFFTPSTTSSEIYVVTGQTTNASNFINWSSDGSNWYSSLSYSVSPGTVDRSQVRYLSTNLFGVGCGAGFYISSDGKNWTRQSGNIFYDGYWTDIAYNGSVLVAIGAQYIFHSSNLGVNWSTGPNCNMNEYGQYSRYTSFALSYKSSTGMFIAAGGGIKYTTNPAVGWSNTTGNSGAQNDIALGGVNQSRWVAVGSAGGFYSDNGVNWSACTNIPSGDAADFYPNSWTVAYSPTLDLWVFGGYQQLRTSANGATFGANIYGSSGIGLGLIAKMEWHKDRFYAVGSAGNASNMVVMSLNGSNWSPASLSGAQYENNIFGLTYQQYATKSVAYGQLLSPIPYSTTVTTSGANILINNNDIATGYYDATGMYSSIQVQGLVSSPSLISTVEGLSTLALNYYENSEVTSTITGLGTAGYISSVALTLYASSMNVSSSVLGSTLSATTISSTSNAYSTTAANYLYLVSSTTPFLIQTDGSNITIGGNAYTSKYLRAADVPSTISGFNYVSTNQLISTTQGMETYISTFIDPVELTSTVIGLGTATYTSSSALDYTLTSTTAGLGSALYVSSLSLISTLDGLRANMYGASATFNSTISRNMYISNSLVVNSNAYFQAAASFSNLADLNASSFLSVADMVSTVDSVLYNQPTVRGLQTYGF